MQKEIIFKSKDYVEGVIAATIDAYEQQNGVVSFDSDVLFSVRQINNKYEVCIFIPVTQTVIHDRDTGDHLETKYVDFEITLSPTEKLSSFLDDLDTALCYLSNKQLEIIHKNV